MSYLNRRPRRNRKSAAVRDLTQETVLTVKDLIYPMFVVEGKGVKSEIKSMPGIHRFSIDTLLEDIREVVDLGIPSVCLFANYPDNKKDSIASESYREGTLYLDALKAIKDQFPQLALMTDIAMDPYSSDGHDGYVENGEVINDITLEILGKMAVAQAKAGADILGPSDMMDGRVGYIRSLLDDEGYTNVSIMSYTAKYASAYYGPFRDALESAPKFGDKKTYQMNPANKREALIEAQLDIEEGADFLMVKPALAYLDIISMLHETFDLPVTAYNVSGEYAMVKAAAQQGWLDGEKIMMENLMSIRRAGAKGILTYFAKEAAQVIWRK